MLEKERKASIGCNNRNVEFRKGNIEEKIPIDDNSVDVVISNCVINLTSNKTNTFKRNLSYIENKWKSKNDYF